MTIYYWPGVDHGPCPCSLLTSSVCRAAAGLVSSGSTSMVVRDASDKTTATITVTMAFADIASLRALSTVW